MVKDQPFFKRTDPTSSVCYHDKKDIIHAILYATKGGIKWRSATKGLPSLTSGLRPLPW